MYISCWEVPLSSSPFKNKKNKLKSFFPFELFFLMFSPLKCSTNEENNAIFGFDDIILFY